MFDLIFDALSAWNQIGLLIMGIVFLLIGGALAGYEIYWLAKAKRVKGRITAVRVKQGRRANTSSSSLRRKLERDRDDAAREDLVADDDNVGDDAAKPIGGLFILLFIGLPLIFSGIGVYTGYKYINLANTGEYVEATIVRKESNHDSDGGTTYNAVVGFNDLNGRYWENKDGISYGSSPSYEQGSKVGVYYNPSNPKTFAIADFWHNMALAFILVFVGIAFIGIFALAVIYNKRQDVDESNDEEQGPGTKKDKQNFANELYYAVFEYQAPNGNRMEHESDMGSNSLLKKVPGRRVTLMMFPKNPEKVRRPSVILLIFGVVFLIPGVFILNTVFTTFETNYMTVVLVLAGFAFLAYKIKSIFNRIPEEEFKKGWADLKKNGVNVTTTSGGSSKNARVLDASEIAARVKVQAKHTYIAGYVLLLIALGLSGGAYYTGLDMVDMTQNGVPAKGKVVDVKSRYSSSSSSSSSRYTYYAVVKFTDMNGRDVRFEDSVGSNHPLHKKGDKVDVLYKLDNAKNAMIDRGLWNWGLSGGLAFGALLLYGWGCTTL